MSEEPDILDPQIQRQEARNKQLRALAKKDAQTRKTVLQALMSDPSGRRFVWVELAKANVFASTYVPGSFDQTAFKEGQRSIGLALNNEVSALCPNDYQQMVRENATAVIVEEKETENE